jgi:hypothetical protein
MSDVEVTTIATRSLSNRRIVARALGGILRPYDADGVEPRLVADFADNFYFANNYSVPLSTAFTHARSSSATMVDSTGTLITVGSNVPRIGHHVYNGSAWVNEGYLHESESRTNEITYSEDFTNAAWSALNVTMSASAEVAPDGQLSAYTYTPSTTSNGLSETVTVVANSTNTVSAFVKADTAQWIRLVVFEAGASTNRITGWFDIQNGVVGSAANGGTGSGATVSIEDFGGFYRIALSGSVGNSATSVTFQVSPAAADSSTTGTLGIFDIYGAQFEEGSTPSSYIPTSGSTVTRSADTMTASNLPWPAPTALSAKNKLVNEFGWVITDGGGV